MSDKLITLSNIGCRYKYRSGLFKTHYYEAIKDVSLSICKGTTVGVIGRNGAGKSTLLRIIAGIIKPDAGTITYHRQLSISLLTLGLGFSHELNGRDNAILGAMLFGYNRQQIMGRLEGIKEFSELGDWFEEPIKSYSSGMRARLGFALAMEMSPDVLLVDEVLGVGDEAFGKKSTQAMMEKMKSGQTVVFVSHDAETVRHLCTSVAWIEDGVTRMYGQTDEVVSQYQQWLHTRQGA